MTAFERLVLRGIWLMLWMRIAPSNRNHWHGVNVWRNAAVDYVTDSIPTEQRGTWTQTELRKQIEQEDFPQ